MARLYTGGAEYNSITSGVEWSTVSGAGVTIDTGTVRTGSYSLKLTSTAGTRQGVVQQFKTVATAGPFYLRFYLNIAVMPTGGASSNAVAVFSNGSGIGSAGCVTLNVQSTGELLLQYADAGSVFHSVGLTGVLSTGTWYCVEVGVNNAGGAGAGFVEGRLDGVVFGVTSTATIFASFLAFRLGSNLLAESQSTGVYYFDDWALNDNLGSFQNAYPGSGKVIRLKPNAAGDINTFATQTGGTAGSANNFTRVNEVAPDDLTTYNGSTTLNQEDLFNIDNSGISSSDTVNVVEVWGRHRNDTADSAQAIKYEAKQTSISQSAAIIPNSTTWTTNSSALNKPAPLVLYQDPTNTNWTNTTLDSLQVGYKLTVDGTGSRLIQVTSVSAIVDYTPQSSLSISKSDNVAVTESINGSSTSLISSSDTITTTDIVTQILDSDGTLLSDTATISESQRHYSDQIEVMEYVSLFIPIAVLAISVSETVTLTESAIGFPTPLRINASESVLVTDTPGVLTSSVALQLNPGDNSTISESVVVLITQLFINKSDSVTVSESVQVPIVLATMANDAITLTESLLRDEPVNISTSESATVTESVSIQVATLPNLSVNKSDSITISESIARLESPMVQVATATASASSVPATFATTPVQGNLLLAWVYSNVGTSNVAGWTLANAQSFVGNSSTASLFYKQAGASESTTVTAANGSSTYMELQIIEYAVSGATLDQTATSADAGVNVTSQSSGTTASTTAASELVVAGVAQSADQGGGVGWTNSFSGRAVTSRLALAERTVSTTGNYSTVASWTTGAHAVGIIATFNSALSVAVSDTATITESGSLKREYSVTTSDFIFIDDETSVGAGIPITISVSDTAPITEFVTFGATTSTASVSDTSAVSESIAHYSDSVDVNESVVVALGAASGVLSTSDSVTVSERIAHYSDEVTVGESIQLLLSNANDVNIALGDTIITSEFVDVDIEESFVAIDEDSVIVSEFVDIIRFTTILARDIILTDTRILDETGDPLLDENGGFIFDENASGDYITVTESVQISRKTDFFVTVSDSISTNEVVVVQSITGSPRVFDAIAISESVTLLIPEMFCSITENASITEVISVQLEQSQPTIPTFDVVAVSESSSVFIPTLSLRVLDSITVLEVSAAQLPTTGSPQLFDTIFISESVNLLIPVLFLSVLDTITITESLPGPTLSLQVADVIVISELVKIKRTNKFKAKAHLGSGNYIPETPQTTGDYTPDEAGPSGDFTPDD